MGSIRDTASISSASSSSSATCRGHDSSSTPLRRPSNSSTRPTGSVASLTRRFEDMQPRQDDGPKEAEKEPAGEASNRRGRNVGCGSRSLESSAAVVDERKPRRRSTSARPATVGRSAAAQRSLGAESAQVPVNRRRPEIPVCKKGQEAEPIRPTPQQGIDQWLSHVCVCLQHTFSGVSKIKIDDRLRRPASTWITVDAFATTYTRPVLTFTFDL